MTSLHKISERSVENQLRSASDNSFFGFCGGDEDSKPGSDREMLIENPGVKCFDIRKDLLIHLGFPVIIRTNLQIQIQFPRADLQRAAHPSVHPNLSHNHIFGTGSIGEYILVKNRKTVAEP